jgi:hypothetical protein
MNQEMNRDLIGSAMPADGDLNLLLVSGVTDGQPVFEGLGEETRIVSLVHATDDHRGKLAVCRPASSAGESLLVVLGFVASSAETIGALLSAVPRAPRIDGQEGLLLRFGRSELRLDPDGQISLVGDDVSLRARRGMRVRGATIDLN